MPALQLLLFPQRHQPGSDGFVLTDVASQALPGQASAPYRQALQNDSLRQITQH